MQAPISLLIVEDSPLFRQLLVTALREFPELEISAAVESVAEARSFLNENNVDVAVLDIDLPDGNGISLAVSLRRQYPTMGVLLLSDGNFISTIKLLPIEDQRGISYLLKASTTQIDTVVRSIKASSLGATVIDSDLTAGSSKYSHFDKLTHRQKQVLQLVAAGLGNEAIAERLGLSTNSIVNHLTGIYKALDIPEGSNARVSAVLTYLELKPNRV
jgi:DNA-binding NarL/FixJ family response regulator